MLSLVHVRGSAIGLAAAALVLVVVAGAEGGSSRDVAPIEVGNEAPCKSGPPCTIINGFAGGDEKGEKYVAVADVIAAARPAAACPAIARDYAVAGIEVDGFLGPCPTSVDMQTARIAAGVPASIGLVAGGAR